MAEFQPGVRHPIMLPGEALLDSLNVPLPDSDSSDTELFSKKVSTPLPVKHDRERLERLSRKVTDPSRKTRSSFKTTHVPPTPELKKAKVKEARKIVVQLGLDRPLVRSSSTPPSSRAISPCPRGTSVAPLASAASGSSPTHTPLSSSGPRPSSSVLSSAVSGPSAHPAPKPPRLSPLAVLHGPNRIHFQRQLPLTVSFPNLASGNPCLLVVNTDHPSEHVRPPPVTPDSAASDMDDIRRDLIYLLDHKNSKINRQVFRQVLSLFDDASRVITGLLLTTSRLQGRLQSQPFQPTQTLVSYSQVVSHPPSKSQPPILTPMNVGPSSSTVRDPPRTALPSTSHDTSRPRSR